VYAADFALLETLSILNNDNLKLITAAWLLL
jgi:hypothetical protein